MGLIIQNKLHFTIIYFLLVSNDLGLFAQEKNDFSLETGFKYGQIFKHTPRFQPIVDENSAMYELGFSWQTVGKKRWQQIHGYPIIGLQLLHARYGNPETFGQSYGIFPSLTFLNRFKRLALHYRIGVGISYITRSFHAITNPTNNVIGSNWNNVTMFQLGAAYQFSSKFQAITTLSFTHFSNGRVQFPNLGINIPAAGLTLKYTLNEPTPRQFYRKDSLPRLKKPIRFALKLAHGFQSLGSAGGPKYPVYIFSPYIARRMNWKGQLQLGIDINYYMSVYQYVLDQVVYMENEHSKSLKIAPYLGYEFLFGRLSVVAQLGVYVYDPFLQRGPLPTKLLLQYYLLPTDQHFKQQAFLSVGLKSHYATADFVEIGLGVVF